MPKRRDLLENLSQDDPNYEIAKHFYHESWADSHGLVADAIGGNVSLAGFIESCVNSFEQGARTEVEIQDATSVDARCRELDAMAKKSTRLISKKLSSASKRFGKANTTAAIAAYTQRVNGIAARSQQRMHEEALASSARKPDALTEAVIAWPPLGGTSRPIKLNRYNRLIIKGLASDRVVNIKSPRMTYEFPESFPQPTRAKVMASRLRAEETLAEKKGAIEEFLEAETLLLDLVLNVFGAFAEEACKLGTQLVVSAEEVESECLKFLSSYAKQAGLMDISPLSSSHMEIPDHLQSRIERTNEWREYRKLLQGVALVQAEDKPSEGSEHHSQEELMPEEDQAVRRSPKEFVDASRRRPKRSYEKFAALIGIGKDTLYAITKESRWVSDATYDVVAEVCKCQPGDLHPRDIPLPARREP